MEQLISLSERWLDSVFGVKISYLTREMTIDGNTIVTLHMKGHSNSSIARSYIFAVKRFARCYKSSIRQKKYAIDQVRVENKQSELILKDEFATRIELDFPRKAACRMRRVDWRLLLNISE